MALDQVWPSLYNAVTNPAPLPDNFLQSGYNEGNVDNILETTMDYGPAKRRKKQTKAYKPITGNMLISTAQKATFQAFFTGETPTTVPAMDVGDIGYGALPFTMPTYGGQTIDVYLNSHSISPKSGGQWTLALNLKTLI